MPARCLLALLLLLPVAVSRADDRDRTVRADVVALLAGREVAGREDLAVTRGRYTYWFAGEESRRAFEADPPRYEIQLGGACARMGPLSGEGSTEIRAVHDGRLYIFASEACRRTFLARADELLESDDSPPAWTPDSARRGRELLELAVEAVGGAEALDSVRTYAERHEREVESGGETYRVVKSAWIELPDSFRRAQAWNDDAWGAAVSGHGAVLFAPGETWEMVPAQRRSFEREMGRHLLLVLRRRHDPGVLATRTGAGTVGETAVEYVAVARDGLTSTLGVDVETGRVLSLRYRGRGPDMSLGVREERYSDFRRVGPLTLPFTREVLFEGEPYDRLARTLDSVEIDGEVDAALFPASR